MKEKRRQNEVRKKKEERRKKKEITKNIEHLSRQYSYLTEVAMAPGFDS